MKYEFHQCIGARLRRLSRVVDIEFRQQLSDYDITENQMTILFVLKKTKEIEQGKIGSFLVLQRSTVSRNLRLLEKQGLIKKTQDYRPIVKLTQKGKRLVEELIPLWENIMDHLLEKIGKKGMKSLFKLEEKLL